MIVFLELLNGLWVNEFKLIVFLIQYCMVEIEIILHAFEGILQVLLVGVRGHAIAYFLGFYTYCSPSYIHLVYFEDKYM